LPTLIAELKQLTIQYAKQETIEPLKGLGRFLAAGVIGSFALGIGLVLWVLAALRALQTETGDHLTGHLTWVPYVVALLACGIVIALSVFAISKDKRAAERRKVERAAKAGEASTATATGDAK